MTQTPSSEVTDAISSEVEEQELDLGLHDLDASDTESYNNIHNICNRTTTQQQHIIITPDTYPLQMVNNGINTMKMVKSYTIQIHIQIHIRIIIIWYAQYLESNNDIENTMIYYEKAFDYVSMVRLYCGINDIYNANKIVNKSISFGYYKASYRLALYYEENNQINNTTIKN